MKTIDAHIHIFERPYSDLLDNSHVKEGEAGELHLFEEYRRRHDIEAAFVICHEDGPCPRNSGFVASLGESRRWIHSFGHARPGLPAFAADVRRVLGEGHFGVSCYLREDDPAAWLADDALAPVWEELAGRGVPLSLTIWPRQCGSLRRVARRFGELSVLVNHMGRPPLVDGKLDVELYQEVLALAEFGNVGVKLSGAYAFSAAGWLWPQSDLFPALDLLRRDFGAGRLLFASDFSPVLEYNTYQQALEFLRVGYGGFPEAELELVHHANARRIIAGRGA